jgi:Domain of unknown function (DUF1707)
MDLERHDPGLEPGIRASDAERDRVVGLLKQHFTDGRLSMDEFSDRMDVAFSARTRGELVTTLRELPVLAQHAAPGVAPERVRVRPRRAAPPVPAIPLVMLAVLLVMLVVVSRGLFLWPLFFLLFWMNRGPGRRSHHHHHGHYSDWSRRRGW